MGTGDVIKKANYRKVTKSGADSCLFCEYRVLSKDKQQVSCKLHNVILGVGEDFGSGEYVCDCFQESEWFGMTVKMLKEDSQQNNLSTAKPSSSNTNKEGCYIATAVYGGYDKPEVLVLRQFRDNVLKKSWIGRVFIKIYYKTSPFWAQKLKGHSAINRKVKVILDKIVRKVSSCENTKGNSV